VPIACVRLAQLSIATGRHNDDNNGTAITSAAAAVSDFFGLVSGGGLFRWLGCGCPPPAAGLGCLICITCNQNPNSSSEKWQPFFRETIPITTLQLQARSAYLYAACVLYWRRCDECGGSGLYFGVMVRPFFTFYGAAGQGLGRGLEKWATHVGGTTSSWHGTYPSPCSHNEQPIHHNHLENADHSNGVSFSSHRRRGAGFVRHNRGAPATAAAAAAQFAIWQRTHNAVRGMGALTPADCVP